ncbi:hypothetical protein FACS1894184_08120 [Clostridia bacterium]|nr:hypothetical protein FACS1894184_08120 [Clostridia bacterium]
MLLLLYSSARTTSARAYTREEPVTRKRDAEPVTPERDADPVTPESDAEPVTKKRDAKEKAIAAAIRGQVVKALDEVIQDTETSEKAADFLISNAETHDQLECVMKNFRREVKNGEATQKPVRRLNLTHKSNIFR